VITVSISLSEIAQAQEWEYLTVSFRDEIYEKSMKLIGENGWELVSTRRVFTGLAVLKVVITEAVFKRQKSVQNLSYKSIDQTKNMIDQLDLEYQADVIAKAEKSSREISLRNLREIQSRVRVTGDKNSKYLSISLEDFKKDGIFLHVNTIFKNIGSFQEVSKLFLRLYFQPF